MRRGECCGLKWCDIDWEQRSIHICRNAVKVTDKEIFVKEPKTRAGNRYVYFSAEMESLLREYQKECRYITETYDQRQLTADDFLFRRQGAQLPMTPTTFTYRFKLILKKNGLPQELNVHSLRHTAASLMIAGGTDVATVAGILGHSQPSTTLDIYSHAFDKNKKAASAGLQGMLEIQITPAKGQARFAYANRACPFVVSSSSNFQLTLSEAPRSISRTIHSSAFSCSCGGRRRRTEFVPSPSKSLPDTTLTP